MRMRIKDINRVQTDQRTEDNESGRSERCGMEVGGWGRGVLGTTSKD